MYKYKLVSEALTHLDAEGREPTAAKQDRAHRFAEAVCNHLSAKMCLKNSCSYWIYRDDCPYCLGWVAYGDSCRSTVDAILPEAQRNPRRTCPAGS